MKILTVVGARPQFIKSGPMSQELRRAGIREILVHTGQHYDLNMSDVFFFELDLAAPDHFLGAGSGPHGEQTGRMLKKIESLLFTDRPDGVLVYGDTNSTLAGALAAAKLHIPVIHVEAGLRSFSRQMPEETNRVLTDHMSTLLFCPTDVAVANLQKEGIAQGVHMVGDVMKDALDLWSGDRPRSAAVVHALGLAPGDYYLSTVHRAENTDNTERLNEIFTALNDLDLPVIMPVHPRTRPALTELTKAQPGSLRLVDPVGYSDMIALTQNARAVLTDSGGLQKEAYMLGVPCITMRDQTEWVETVDAGWNSVVGADSARITKAVHSIKKPSLHPQLYGDGKSSRRMVNILKGSLSR